MSVELAKALIERIKSDIVFKVRLISIDNVDEKLKFIHSEGYLCTEEEIKDAEIEAHSSLGVQRGRILVRLLILYQTPFMTHTSGFYYKRLFTEGRHL